MKKYLLSFILIALISCGYRVKDGNVVDKRYEPERTFIMLLPMVMSTGKTTTTILIPYYVRDDEDWVITIKGWNPESKEYETSEFYVDKEFYGSIKMGDYVDFRNLKFTTEDEHEKLKKANG